jgi:hypothetical protein
MVVPPATATLTAIVLEIQGSRQGDKLFIKCHLSLNLTFHAQGSIAYKFGPLGLKRLSNAAV